MGPVYGESSLPFGVPGQLKVHGNDSPVAIGNLWQPFLDRVGVLDVIARGGVLCPSTTTRPEVAEEAPIRSEIPEEHEADADLGAGHLLDDKVPADGAAMQV